MTNFAWLGILVRANLMFSETHYQYLGYKTSEASPFHTPLLIFSEYEDVITWKWMGLTLGLKIYHYSVERKLFVSG